MTGINLELLNSLKNRQTFQDSKSSTDAYHQELQDIMSQISRELSKTPLLASVKEKKDALELIQEVAIRLSNEAFINAHESLKLHLSRRFDILKQTAFHNLQNL